MAKVLKRPTPVSKKKGGMTAPDGMVVLFTIVDKKKGDLYADLIQCRSQSDVFHDGQMWEDIELLEDHADLLTVNIDIGAFRIKLFAFEADFTGRRFLEHVETIL